MNPGRTHISCTSCVAVLTLSLIPGEADQFRRYRDPGLRARVAILARESARLRSAALPV